MKDVRYPEYPQVSIDGPNLSIEYNGLKINIEPTPNSSSQRVEISRLEKDLTGEVEVKEFELRDNERASLQKINLKYNRARQYFLDVVKKHAYWVDDSSAKRLDNLLAKHLCPDYTEEPAVQARGPMNNFEKERQRQEFCNVWKLVFSRNITPTQAAKILGYDPDDYY